MGIYISTKVEGFFGIRFFIYGFSASSVLKGSKQPYLFSYNLSDKETTKNNLIYIPITLVEIFFTVETNLFKNNLWQIQ